MFSHGHLGRVFTAIGFIVAAYGGYLWLQIEPLDDNTIEQRVELSFQQEMHRMQVAQAQRLARVKDQLPNMSPEEQALVLYQASEPMNLSDEQKARHRQAIRRDITEHYAYRRKKASSLIFLGMALLFMTLTPKLVQRFMDSRD